MSALNMDKVEYNTHRVYIRHVLTHEEYNRGKWKE
jgi:mRNA-degrading endonuclease HigB of HigAB toxin-antitoxin module